MGQLGNFKLGKWLVEPSLGKVSSDDESVSIRPREMDLLVYLARCAGEVVSTEDLITNVWAGVSVTNDSLYFSMSQLRKVLDGDESGSSVIETLPKRGYRVVVPVEFSQVSSAVTMADESPDTLDPKSVSVDGWLTRRGMVAGIGVLAVVFLLAWNWTGNSPSDLEDVSAPPRLNSIAVMPFIDLTPETDYTYFSDGITEEILNRLTRIRGLQVAARTSSFSFKFKESDIVDIGRSLGVSTILEGSVRKEGDRVRISAQLIDAESGFQLWSNTYERELSSVFAIQNEISRRIIDALQLTLAIESSGEVAADVKARDPQALDEYLMGLDAYRTFSFDSLDRAAGHFETALLLDPSFVQARVQLAATKFRILNTGASFDETLIDDAKALASEAIDQEPQNGAAHRVLAQAYKLRGQREESERELIAALAIAPSDSQSILQLSQLTMIRGDADGALKLLRQAERLDPLGEEVLQYLGNLQQRTGKIDLARETFSRAVDLHPQNPNNSWMLGKLQVNDLGEISRGLQSFLKSARMDPKDYEIAAYVAMTYLSLEMPVAAEPWIQSALANGPGTITTVASQTVYLMLTGETGRASQLAIDALLNRPSRFKEHEVLSESLINIAVNHLISTDRADEAIRLLVDAGPGTTRNSDTPVNSSPSDSMPGADGMSRRWLIALACAYRANGELRKAGETLDRIAGARLNAMKGYRAKLRNSDYLIEAEVLAIEGNVPAALDMLEAAVDANLYFNWQIRIGTNSAFSDLQSEQRFVDLLEQVRQKINAEREIIPDTPQLAFVGGL